MGLCCLSMSLFALLVCDGSRPGRVDRGAIGAGWIACCEARVEQRSERSDSTVATLWERPRDARRGLEVSDLPVQLGAVLIVLAMAGWWSTDHELGLVSLEVSA